MNKTALVLSVISVVLAFCVVLLGVKTGGRLVGTALPKKTWTPEQQRTLANKLRSAGLRREAIAQYAAYLDSASLDAPQRAALCYTIGTMLMEESEYEKALAWLYRVEIADPDAPVKSEAGSKIIHCLEKLGKYSAAEYALDKRSRGTTDNRVDTEDPVVARIGSETIRRSEVTEAFDGMPSWLRDQYAENKQKTEFLKKYVADELLYRKAIKLEYAKEPEVLKRMRLLERELLINRVLEDELKGKITMAEDDLKNYFEAHRDTYREKEAVQVAMIKAGLPEIAESILAELKQGKDFEALAGEVSLDEQTAKNAGRVSRWIRKGEDDLGIGNTRAVSQVLFSTPEGEVTPVVEAGGYYYVFRILDTRQERMPAYTEVADRVKTDYYMQKMQRSYQELLEQVLKTAEVKLYPDAMHAGDDL